MEDIYDNAKTKILDNWYCSLQNCVNHFKTIQDN